MADANLQAESADSKPDTFEQRLGSFTINGVREFYESSAEKVTLLTGFIHALSAVIGSAHLECAHCGQSSRAHELNGDLKERATEAIGYLAALANFYASEGGD
ncbi:hypothetical protein BSL82_04940 [Tardibacter chloracetimidivorans]|uniref:Uncharacterized protein n=1 Tax=Tardibacter chloracetimidivorans TaxID=1921510 RepID=A0A1L3ZT18_9SPHN|nr:hypothetical protein [Tardibacter chloracetimidivorans]API58740.1 hypothetical protein BSL82_04940 [Tardibacter chloracetimidivorans]